MADELEPQPAGGAGSGRKGRLVPAVVIAVLMGLEGVGVFFVTKMLADPAPAAGESDAATTTEDGLPVETESVEVELADCRPTNNRLGRLVTLHLRVSAVVAASEQERVEQIIEAKKARIEDRISVVMRGVDPKYLNEPELATIKRRIKRELDAIFGDDELIQEVLIPHWQQVGPGD